MTNDVGILAALMGTIIQVINVLVSILVAPISILVAQYLPAVDSALQYVASYLSLVTTDAAWVINALGVPQILLTMIAFYYTFSIGLSIASFGIKIATRWFIVAKVL